AFEPDFQDVRIGPGGVVDTDHAIDEQPASAVAAGRVEFAGGVADRPVAFGAVFGPWQQGARLDLVAQFGESLPDLRRQRFERLAIAIYFRLVHEREIVCKIPAKTYPAAGISPETEPLGN